MINVPDLNERYRQRQGGRRDPDPPRNPEQPPPHRGPGAWGPWSALTFLLVLCTGAGLVSRILGGDGGSGNNTTETTPPTNVPLELHVATDPPQIQPTDVLIIPAPIPSTILVPVLRMSIGDCNEGDPGGGADLWYTNLPPQQNIDLTMSYSPCVSNSEFGFLVSGRNLTEKSSGGGCTQAVSFFTEGGGPATIQVYNYMVGSKVCYTLDIRGLDEMRR